MAEVLDFPLLALWPYFVVLAGMIAIPAVMPPAR